MTNEILEQTKKMTLDEEVQLVESKLKNGDWVIFKGYNFIGKSIQAVCESETQHGEPLFKSPAENWLLPTSNWVAMDSHPPRMTAETIKDILGNCRNKKYEIVICRQKIENDSEKFEKVAYDFAYELNKVRPFYNIFSYPKLIYYCWKLREKQKALRKMQRAKMRDLNVEKGIIDEITKLYKAMSEITYCTQILYNMWVKYGRNIFKEFYNVPFCRPTEHEKLLRDNKYEFIYGYWHGEPSDELYQRILKKQTNL